MHINPLLKNLRFNEIIFHLLFQTPQLVFISIQPGKFKCEINVVLFFRVS